ncbi:MAG: protease inhibitor I42 family protein [Clostridia bacterium]|nr:protease inhibitor I42 family protein [Clostridia bacterium]
MLAILQKILAFFTSLLMLLGISLPGAGQLNEKEGYQISGSSVTFHFLANPTTGYDWTMTQEGDAVALEEAHYTADPVPPGTGGGGGVKYFTFTATQPGTATLRFVYGRSWENDPGRIITAVIAVSKDGKLTVSSLAEQNLN